MVHTTFERLPQEKKDRILRSARAEFIRLPYEKTSINRILAEAGIPKGSFYQYFDDKSDLFCLCICAVYEKLIAGRRQSGERLLESGMLRMKELGYDEGYRRFAGDLKKYLSEEDFRLFENMLAAPPHIRNHVQMQAARSRIAPVLAQELRTDKNVRRDIDHDYYGYLLALTEVVPVEYCTSKGMPMEELFYFGYLYMRSIYDSIRKICLDRYCGREGSDRDPQAGTVFEEDEK